MTLWNFRPTALQLSAYATSFKETLLNYYELDNDRAQKEGVSIPPKPKHMLRTLQWNIHGFTSPRGGESVEITDGIIECILEADADVIVLNEYHWSGRDNRHRKLAKLLIEKGYSCFCGTVSFPTFMATRWYNQEPMKEVRLSEERSAIIAHIADPSDEQKHICVAGTHLHFAIGDKRRAEMENLLPSLEDKLNGPVLVMGDLNQQRQQDYPHKEWERIAEGMDHRNCCRDDGVDKLLKQAKFECSWDHPSLQHTNWETTKLSANSYPPSTHWTGTVVDYSYGNYPHIQANGVYVSPAGWSDHRMTVCDWKLTPSADSESE